MSHISVIDHALPRTGPITGQLTGIRRVPLLLYGILLFCVGIGMYMIGVLMFLPRFFLGLNTLLLPLNEWIVWYSGMPVMLGFVLMIADLFLFFPARRTRMEVRHDPVGDGQVTVVLTAYNDELSIAAAVEDFVGHKLVRNVIVVSNNSSDATLERASAAGVIAFNEQAQGYGRCQPLPVP